MTCQTCHHACHCREAKIQKLVKALEFYADFSNNTGQEGDYISLIKGQFIPTDSDIPIEYDEPDCGRIAIKTLEEWKA